MSNSNLVSYVDSGSSNYNQRTGPISKITIHHAAGKLTLQQFSNIMHSPSREVSWNYAIAYDGSIGLFIPESYRAWTTSNRDNDMVAITIEVSNSSNGEPWPISDESYKSLINLCEDICRRNNITAIKYTGDKSGNLTMHKWFASTGCPGTTLSAKFPEIMNEVNKRLGQPCTLQYVTNPLTGEVTAAGLGQNASIISVDSLIDYSAFTPYVATIDRNVKSVDFDKLKESGVCIVMIEAGRLYNDNHQEVELYSNPLIDSQVVGAGKASIDYGLVADVRAHSVEEANKELKELTRIIQKYTPPYGIWLNINLSSDRATNNKIIDRYEFVLQALGLKDKIGLYATRAQMKRIDWTEKRQNVWYLWLNDHVEESEHLSQILSPEFFMFDESKASDVPVINNTIYTSSGTSSTTFNYTDWLFVGDSRTVGMSNAVGNIDFVAKVGSGYNFMTSQLTNIKNTYHNANIVFWFGVNDLGNIDKYIAAYNDLCMSMSDCKIVVATVGPTSGSYTNLMPDIQDFNAELKTGLNPNIALIDVFSKMVSDTFNSSDGLHYDTKTYKCVYNYIVKGTYTEQ